MSTTSPTPACTCSSTTTTASRSTSAPATTPPSARSPTWSPRRSATPARPCGTPPSPTAPPASSSTSPCCTPSAGARPRHWPTASPPPSPGTASTLATSARLASADPRRSSLSRPRSPPQAPSPGFETALARLLNQRLSESGAGVDHPGADGDAGRLVDQDERARGAVLGVRVAQQRHGGAQLDAADLVEAELLGVLVAVQGVHVEAVLDVLDQRAAHPGRVLDRELLTRGQRLVGHPADHRVDVLARLRGVLDPGDHVAAAHVDVVGEADGDRHRREGLGDLLVEHVDGLDGRGHPTRQDDDLVTGLEHPTGDLAGVPAVVVELVALRAYDVLHREAGVDQVAVGGDVDVLEVVHQRRAVVPRRVLRAGHDVVALERRDRDDLEVGDRQLRRERRELLVDPLVDLLGPVDEVHLVDREQEVRHP